MIKNKQTITVRDVAKEAGVSTATVSRVMNEKSLVSSELQSRVLDAVTRLKYRPNRSALQLRSGKVKRIGVLFADISNPFFTSVLAGIENILQSRRYVLVLGNSNEDPIIEKLQMQSFLDEGVSGIIFSPVSNKNSQFEAIINSGVPLLMLDRTIPMKSPVDSVTINNYEVAKKATDYLLSLGHRRIGFIGGLSHTSTSLQREEGYKFAMNNHSEASPIIGNGFFRQVGGYQAMIDMLNGKSKPTAVLVANNLMTLGAMQAIIGSGLSIPDEVALMGFDDMSWSNCLQPSLTSISQPTFEMGQIAANLLLNRIHHPQNASQNVILESKLIIRESSGGQRKTQRLKENLTITSEDQQCYLESHL